MARLKSIAKALLLNSGLALLVPIATWCFDPTVSLASLTRVFVVSLVFANCVGTLLRLTTDRLWMASIDWPIVSRWMFRAASIAALAALGTLVGSVVLQLLGLTRSYWEMFLGGYRFALVIAGGATLTVAAYEGLKSRLEATRLELKQKELERERAVHLATTATLSSLESRIHPHFLFNTLNSISSLIHEDPQKAERTIGRLADLLRFSLDAPQLGLVPLSHEMKIVEDYLEIEKTRLGDRLRYTVHWDPAGAHKVPPLSIQTLVENSIKYAIAPRREGGSVAVRVIARREEVEVQIQDDGPGFEPTAIASGHGIENVESRLKALFSNHPGLSISTRDGCLVQFTVPQS
jgi:two-component system, LytTR family, sensor histidine kinase AlgZ